MKLTLTTGTLVSLTEKEARLVLRIVGDEYNTEGSVDGRPWSWSVCGDKSGAAVLGSLCQKGVTFSEDAQGEGKKDDFVCGFTPEAKPAVQHFLDCVGALGFDAALRLSYPQQTSPVEQEASAEATEPTAEAPAPKKSAKGSAKKVAAPEASAEASGPGIVAPAGSDIAKKHLELIASLEDNVPTGGALVITLKPGLRFQNEESEKAGTPHILSVTAYRWARRALRKVVACACAECAAAAPVAA